MPYLSVRSSRGLQVFFALCITAFGQHHKPPGQVPLHALPTPSAPLRPPKPGSPAGPRNTAGGPPSNAVFSAPALAQLPLRWHVHISGYEENPHLNLKREMFVRAIELGLAQNGCKNILTNDNEA